MKICFVQKQSFPYFGIMALSEVLKQKGHATDVLISTNEDDLISKIKTIGPDIIGMSVHSAEHKWLRETVSKIRFFLPDTPIIVGGIHATLYPEEVLKLGVDYICCGEGEIAFTSLIERLENGQRSARGIPGIGYIENSRPVLQGAGTLALDLDQFIEDRTIYYDRYTELSKLDFKLFMSGRGCPLGCSYCGNALLKEIYKGSRKYIRKKSPRFFVNEIKQVIERYSAKSFYFMDDIFILDYEWLKEFAELYTSEIRLPYFCLGQASLIKEEYANILARSGCRNISVGLETGNENIRKNILNKFVSNEDFLVCSRNLKKYGIKLVTSNMFCLPNETIEDAISTIDLNIKIGTNHMAATMFLPYPKTKLAEYCIEKGLLGKDYSVEDLPTTFLFESVLKKENKEIFGNIQKIAELCLIFPKAKRVLIFLAKKIKFKIFFNFLYLLGIFLRYKSSMELTFFQTLKYFWTQRKQAE
jgi:radical SAM superfamily enzyme YgiQ (UPF0313 family)